MISFGLITAQILSIFSIETVSRFFERYAVFIAGYWLAKGVKNDIKLPLIVGVIAVLLLPLKMLLHFSYFHNAFLAITAFGLCYLLGVFFDVVHISFLRKGLSFLGGFTLETYMLNVSFNWILIRLEPIWKGKIPTWAVYWFCSCLLAVLFAFLIHKLSDYIMKKVKTGKLVKNSSAK